MSWNCPRIIVVKIEWQKSGKNSGKKTPLLDNQNDGLNMESRVRKQWCLRSLPSRFGQKWWGVFNRSGGGKMSVSKREDYEVGFEYV